MGQKAGAGETYSFVPDVFRSLWYYSTRVLNLREHLVTPPGHPRPYESKPWAWPMNLRLLPRPVGDRARVGERAAWAR